MDAQQFLVEFKRIANAPSGIDRLKDMVLDLAIQGRLVFSNESKESTLGLLTQIRHWRDNQSLLKKGRRATTKTIFSDIEKPFSIPDHWIWVRNSDIFRLVKGKNPKDLGAVGTYPYLDVEALDRGNIQRYTNDERAPRSTKADILVVCDGSRSGLVLDGNEGVIGSTLARVDTLPAIQPFVKLLFLHGYRRLNADKKGAAIPHLDTARLLDSPCGLPPLSEQESIVAKVDELMTLCDKLETLQQVRCELQKKLRHSTLQAVSSAASPYEMQSTWACLADNFQQLFHVPEDVADLRNLILNLAANGFVSKPQAGDGDPLVTLGQASLQQKLEFSARELREISALPERTLENGRLRVALGQIVKLVSGQHLSPEEYNTRHEGIPYITGPAEFKDRRPSPTKWTSERRAIARVGDVLITVKGSGVGKTALCDLEELAISRQLMAIRALADIDRSYLSICIDSAEKKFQEQKFGIAIPGIGRDEVLALPVFLPSIQEQGRIVRLVDELMRLCDSLESQLRSAQKVAGRLVIAAISSFTGMTTEQKEELMKAPRTELIVSLRLGTAPDVKAQAPLATILARQNGEMNAKDLWQRFGGEIDAFYAQLKIEVAHGWILEPAPAEMREKPADTVRA